MIIPSPRGQAILRELVSHIESDTIRADRPDTFLGYQQVHESLGLPYVGPTYGESLKRQGLADLAEWTKEQGHPAVTGLIVDMSPKSERYLQPGHGYFELFERSQNPDFSWWRNEITKSLAYDWSPYLGSEPVPPEPPPRATPAASDLANPPERIMTTTYRILRDTALALRVKLLHHYECQICGHTINLPDGSRYAEAHHILPLGKPHDGPDEIANILCLCPNHHAECDYGVRQILLEELRQIEGHKVGRQFVDYHNRRIFGEQKQG
jgi:hypothetical protein